VVASLGFLELFDNKIAFPRDHVAAQPSADHLTDALRDPGFPIHHDVQILGIEHEKARSGDSDDGRGPMGATQRCDLAEKMTRAEPNSLVTAERKTRNAAAIGPYPSRTDDSTANPRATQRLTRRCGRLGAAIEAYGYSADQEPRGQLPIPLPAPTEFPP